jgi:hypothetical protein
VARRKALIVAAVRSGRITLEEACRRYALSIEEFVLWQRAVESGGVAGLQAAALLRRGEQRDTPADGSTQAEGAASAAQSGCDKGGDD